MGLTTPSTNMLCICFTTLSQTHGFPASARLLLSTPSLTHCRYWSFPHLNCSSRPRSSPPSRSSGMLLWSGRLPLSPASAIYASTFFLLVLVHTLSGGLVGHLPALYGLPLSRPRCCQDGTARVGYAVTGRGSQEPADCLTVDKYLVM